MICAARRGAARRGATQRLRDPLVASLLDWNARECNDSLAPRRGGGEDRGCARVCVCVYARTYVSRTARAGDFIADQSAASNA